jgi:protocatechuate 3,4-dioxygenase beta subunit
MTHERRRLGKLVVWALGATFVLGVMAWVARHGTDGRASEISRSTAGPPTNKIVHSLFDSDDARADIQLASVSGAVFDKHGAPIVGAEACVSTDAAQLRSHGPTLRCVRTTAGGRYRVDGIAPVRVQIQASAPGYQPGGWSNTTAQGRMERWLALTPAGVRTGINVTLAAGGVRLAGVVRDVAGGVIEGATVRAEPSGSAGAPAFGRSDEHGRFGIWVAPGEVEVDATAPGYARASRRYRAPSELAELVLVPESVLVGRVVDARSGAPVADAEVWPGPHRAFRFDRGPELDGPLVRTDVDGRFRIDGLVPGLYAPGAVAEHHYGKAPELVELGLGETSDPIEIRVHPSLEVRGRVVIADTDAPCPEPKLTLHGLAGPARGRPLADGEVEVLGLLAGQ